MNSRFGSGLRWLGRASSMTLIAVALVGCREAPRQPDNQTTTRVGKLSTASVAYIFDFGTGVNDTAGPGSGSSIFVNAVTGSAIGSGSTGTYNGAGFTDVPISAIESSPSTALNGFDTAILYEVCDIGSHPTALVALNQFVDAGHKLLIFDADGCSDENGGLGTADYSGFLFPFTTNSPGPAGAGGSITKVEASTLTTGITVGPVPSDSIGDANIFTSNAGGWCDSIEAKNTNGVQGFVQAYARTLSGGLAIYDGEDFWFTFGPTPHAKQVFDLMLAQAFNPDGLPCSTPASGIKLDPPTQTQNVGSAATLTATVIDSNGNPASGVTVTFNVLSGPDGGTTGTAVTNGAGQAVFSYVNSTAIGTDMAQATFTDTLTHDSNVVQVDWVAQPTTLVYVGATTQDFNDPAILAATLSTSSGPVAGQTLTFTLGGQTCTATTDASGTGSCTIVPNVAAGAYTVTATFAATPSLLASSASAAFTVTLEETTLAYTGTTLIQNGGVAHLAGVLKEDGVTPIGGRTVTFVLGSGSDAQTCAGVTDGSGAAACDINPVAQPLGPGVVNATFAGDPFYLPASASATTLIFAVLDHGSFVVGDGNAALGQAVTFWGAQWWKLNSVSQTGAPASFKGFADQGSPACGGTWSTDPGNSSGPPASVPSFMAVIVSSSITKSGSDIAGNTPEVVIVQTDAGYAANPGHAGTGKVVAVLCP